MGSCPIATSPTKSKSNAGAAEAAPHAGFALDASTIDVYRNTDGVILLYDISKPWTFEYASRALTEMPTNIPVLILVRFNRDVYVASEVSSNTCF